MLAGEFLVRAGWAFIAEAPSNPLNQYLPYILGAGGVGFLATGAKFILALRASAETREAKAIANLERWRLDADSRAQRCLDRLDHQRDLTTYWQTRCGVLEHTMSVAGVNVPPALSPPPTFPSTDLL